MIAIRNDVNPFYAARVSRRPTVIPQSRYAKLPRIPVNASPVPHLTSLYHFHRAGEYGDRSYPGNCGGNLIKDLLRYFKPSLVCDPMAGSGTCRDVCEELNIPCMSWDIHDGFDACDPADFSARDTFDFIWAHPAYWRQKLYANDPRDLSRAPTLDDFLRRYGQFIRNAAKALKPGGKLAILMGDYNDREAGFVPLTFYTLCGCPHNVPNVVQLVMWPPVIISFLSAKKSFAAPHNSATCQKPVCSLPIRTEA
jgi:SAM-dependent methyltransferase